MIPIRVRTTAILLLVILLTAAAVLWFRWQSKDVTRFAKRSAGRRFNVLLITIDTLRADRLGCYGYSEINTANIDGLAAAGAQFLDATAHVPLTLPAHTSIMTGKFPSFHGVHDNGGFYVPKSETTIAQLFKQRGFDTGAFVAAYVLDSSWGLNKGFETYFDNFDLSKEERVGLSSVERKADDVYKEVETWLERHKSRRFFLWTHFYDPHTPYEPPAEYERLYPGRPYIGEIAYTDSVVGKLFARLKALGLWDNTIICLTGDHGESLGEHGESTHAFYVYDSTLHVPLILRTPMRGLEGKKITQQVRSIDIAPTLLQLSGIGSPEAMQGRSLLHVALDSQRLERRPSYAESYYPQYHFGWSRLLSLRDGRYHYVDAPTPELYDLKADPMEQNNVYAAHQEIIRSMKAELDRIAAVQSEGAEMHPGAVDNETHEKLAALGYVGAFAGPIENNTTLPDPKDKIDLFNMIVSARQDSLGGNPDQAIRKFQDVIEIDPKIVDAHFMLGNEYFRKNQYTQAIEEFQKALELKPDYDFAMINLANTYRKMGKIDEALLGFEHFLARNPENTQVLYHIGEIYLTKGEPDRALEYLNRALKVESETSWVYNSMGVAYMQKKDPQKAEVNLLKALQLNPKLTMAHFNLAQLRESQDRMTEAEQEYLAEIRNSPKNFKARFNLGRLYLGQQRTAQGIEQLKAAVEEAPDFALGYLFLAQAYVEQGADLNLAMDAAQKGLSLNPDPSYAPLGHLVLADIYNRSGRHELERRELRLAGRRAN